MTARHATRATDASLAAIEACRQTLAPGFGRYWDGTLTRMDRLWFLRCAGIEARKVTSWASMTADEQTQVRAAWAHFMSGDPRPMPVSRAS